MTQCAGEAGAPAHPFWIGPVRIEEADRGPIESVESARGNTVRRIPSLSLDAAEPVGLLGARDFGHRCP